VQICQGILPGKFAQKKKERREQRERRRKKKTPTRHLYVHASHHQQGLIKIRRHFATVRRHTHHLSVAASFIRWHMLVLIFTHDKQLLKDKIHQHSKLVLKSILKLYIA
jgi:hypothetical protein